MPKPKTFTQDEIENIKHLYQQHDGNVTRVAESLNITWDTARRWLHLLDIRQDTTGRMIPDQRVDWHLYIVQLIFDGKTIVRTAEAPLGGCAIWAVMMLEKLQKPYKRAHVRRINTPPPSVPGFWRTEIENRLGVIPTRTQARTIAKQYDHDRMFE